ncbi:MAG TPA: hypothetical protein VGC07_03105 [Granulicella sp.]
MPDLLLDPSAVSAEDRAHLDVCPTCQQELAALEGTFALLDQWQAPEPSPYFDQKLTVRLREEQAMPPAGWFERLRSRLLFNTGRQFRPILAGAMAMVVLLGGGTYAGISTFSPLGQVEASATVNDLQILDRNAQDFQQMDQLLLQDDDSQDNAAPAVPPRS